MRQFFKKYKTSYLSGRKMVMDGGKRTVEICAKGVSDFRQMFFQCRTDGAAAGNEFGKIRFYGFA